ARRKLEAETADTPPPTPSPAPVDPGEGVAARYGGGSCFTMWSPLIEPFTVNLSESRSLCFSEEERRDVEAFARRAADVPFLGKHLTYGTARNSIRRVPEELRTKARLLWITAGRAWYHVWLEECLIEPHELCSHADLRAWCQFRYQVLDLVRFMCLGN